MGGRILLELDVIRLEELEGVRAEEGNTAFEVEVVVVLSDG